MKAIINARIYDYNRYIENGYLLYDEKIDKCGPMSEFPKGKYEKVEDYKGDLLMPTFVCMNAGLLSKCSLLRRYKKFWASLRRTMSCAFSCVGAPAGITSNSRLGATKETNFSASQWLRAAVTYSG